MEKIYNSTDLKRKISLLEDKQLADWYLLQQEIALMQENLKPSHLIKNVFKDLTTSTPLKNNILGTAVGLTAGLAAKAMAGGFSNNLLKKIFASIIQLRVTNAVSKESGLISSLANRVMGYFKSSKKVY